MYVYGNSRWGSIEGDINDQADLIALITAGSNVWGTITGDIRDQTDLWDALSEKADVASLGPVAFSNAYSDLDGLPSIPTQYTDEMARDAIAAAIASGSHTLISIAHNDPSNTLSFTVDNDLGNYDPTNLLIEKANISDFTETDYVHVTGNETIAGTKTFSSYMIAAGVTITSGGSIRTGTTAGNTWTMSAYDVDGAAYIPFLAATAGNNPSLTGILGSPAGYAAFDAGGNLTFTGGQYLLNLDQYAFAVNGLPITGIKFRYFTGPPGYAFTDLAGGDLASIDVAGAQSYVQSTCGFSSGIGTAAAISANTNDWDLTYSVNGSFRLVSATTPVQVTGMIAPVNPNRAHWFIGVNTSANTITLKHNNASSSAANRLKNQTNADILWVQDSWVFFWYDYTVALWRAKLI